MSATAPQTWEKHIEWPACETCRATGVATDPKTQWPVECWACKSARVNAINRAKAKRRDVVRKEKDSA